MAPEEKPSRPPAPASQGALLVATGALLFLFIPLVLFLFVAHPAPVGLTLAAGIGLMLGHRFLARPYMRRALAAKCLWCNRVLAESPGPSGERLALRAGGEAWTARFCPGHRAPAARFLAFVERLAWPLRLAIFLPLLLLLAELAATALGRRLPGLGPIDLESATDLFRLAVGVAVNVAAWGYLGAAERSPSAIPFPLHNFTLLGIRSLLWIFRLVGIWWIGLALAHLLRR
jgi:hypothetical protein